MAEHNAESVADQLGRFAESVRAMAHGGLVGSEGVIAQIKGIEDGCRAQNAYEGKAQTNPSTLYMDGTSPVTIKIRATSEELRAMHNQTVKLVFTPARNDGDVCDV